MACCPSLIKSLFRGDRKVLEIHFNAWKQYIEDIGKVMIERLGMDGNQ